jgi:hypothetical protein
MEDAALIQMMGDAGPRGGALPVTAPGRGAATERAHLLMTGQPYGELPFFNGPFVDYSSHVSALRQPRNAGRAHGAGWLAVSASHDPNESPANLSWLPQASLQS